MTNGPIIQPDRIEFGQSVITFDLAVTPCFDDAPNPWVAVIAGTDPQYGLQRVFLPRDRELNEDFTGYEFRFCMGEGLYNFKNFIIAEGRDKPRLWSGFLRIAEDDGTIAMATYEDVLAEAHLLDLITAESIRLRDLKEAGKIGGKEADRLMAEFKNNLQTPEVAG